MRIGRLIIIPIVILVGYLPFQLVRSINEPEDIAEQLRAIPGVEVVSIEGFQEWLIYKNIWATIRVRGKHELLIVGLHRNACSYSDHIYLGRVGGISVGATMERLAADGNNPSQAKREIESAQGHFDIGPKGKMATLFPFKVASIRDLVDNVDKIYATLQTIPCGFESRQLFRGGDDSHIYIWTTKGND